MHIQHFNMRIPSYETRFNLVLFNPDKTIYLIKQDLTLSQCFKIVKHKDHKHLTYSVIDCKIKDDLIISCNTFI